jgi:hypothetical protein
LAKLIDRVGAVLLSTLADVYLHRSQATKGRFGVKRLPANRPTACPEDDIRPTCSGGKSYSLGRGTGLPALQSPSPSASSSGWTA